MDDATIEEQVKYWTDLVAAENRVPRFLIRGFVRRPFEHPTARTTLRPEPSQAAGSAAERALAHGYTEFP